MRYYDPASRGFYDTAVHAEIPATATPITKIEYEALLAAQSAGLEIIADADGRPVATERAQPSLAEQLAALRRQRDALLRESDKTQLPDFPISPAERAAFASWRAELRTLPEQWPDVTIPDPPFPL